MDLVLERLPSFEIRPGRVVFAPGAGSGGGTGAGSGINKINKEVIAIYNIHIYLKRFLALLVATLQL